MGDLNAVFQLNHKSFDEAWSIGSLHAALDSGFDLLVCEDEGILAGYILSQDILDEVHIMQVAVDPALRRQGVAATLTAHLLRGKAAMSVVLLEVRASNQAARKLYAKFGFRENGVRKKYYAPDAAGCQEDAILMDLPLRGSAPFLEAL
ncbi:MAG TPA: ribosomal protein S18-alanine N-acetyltransferase [Mariprofundaceae bacterium]|nr:ribosomal protein S18-alanine N-acetyltransferase [Mariprofundaceae bacterium]